MKKIISVLFLLLGLETLPARELYPYLEELKLNLPDTSHTIPLQEMIKLKKKIEEENNCQPHECEFAFFTDFDGTIIYGDITDGIEDLSIENDTIRNGYHGLIRLSIEKGYLNNYKGKEGFRDYWQHYTDLIKNHQEEESTRFMGEQFINLNHEQKKKIEKLAQEYFTEILHHKFFLSSLNIIDELVSSGIKVYVISASPDIFVKQASYVFPSGTDSISGVDLEEEGVDFFNYAEGKVKRMHCFIRKKEESGKKVFVIGAMGNSWSSDYPMIQESIKLGGIGIMINGKKRCINKLDDSSNFYCLNFKSTKED